MKHTCPTCGAAAPARPLDDKRAQTMRHISPCGRVCYVGSGKVAEGVPLHGPRNCDLCGPVTGHWTIGTGK